MGLEVVLSYWVSIKWYKCANIHEICVRSVVVRNTSDDIGMMFVSVESKDGIQNT